MWMSRSENCKRKTLASLSMLMGKNGHAEERAKIAKEKAETAEQKVEKEMGSPEQKRRSRKRKEVEDANKPDDWVIF